MDQQALARRVTRDWVALRDKLPRLGPLKEELHVDPFLLQRLEEGLTNFPDITEFLKNTLSYVFQALARSARSTPSLLELSNIDSALRLLLLGLGAQLALTMGLVPPSPNVRIENAPLLSITEIMNHVRKLQMNFPELGGQRQLVTLLGLYEHFLQVQEEFRREGATLQDDQAPAFFTTYKLKVDSLRQEINQVYRDLVNHLNPPHQEAHLARTHLNQEALTRVLTSLAQEVARLYSLVNQAMEEGANFRDDFIRAGEKKEVVFALINELRNILRRLGNGADSLAVYLGNQVREILGSS